MTLTEYQRAAMQFRLPEATPEYIRYNLAGEVGELLSLEAKLIRDGLPEVEGYVDYEGYIQNVTKELGDILWHVAAIAVDYGFTLDQIAELNLNKLTDRQERNVIKGSGDAR